MFVVDSNQDEIDQKFEAFLEINQKYLPPHIV